MARQISNRAFFGTIAFVALLATSCTRSTEVTMTPPETTTSTTVVEAGKFVVTDDDLEKSTLPGADSADVTSPQPDELASREGQDGSTKAPEDDLDLSPLTETVKALEAAGRSSTGTSNAKPTDPTEAELAKFLEAAAKAKTVQDALDAPKPSAPTTPKTTEPKSTTSTTTTPPKPADPPTMGIHAPRIAPGSTQVFAVSVPSKSAFGAYRLSSCSVVQLFTTASEWVTPSWSGQLYCSANVTLAESDATLVLAIPSDAPLGYYTACVGVRKGSDLQSICGLYEIVA